MVIIMVAKMVKKEGGGPGWPNHVKSRFQGSIGLLVGDTVDPRPSYSYIYNERKSERKFKQI